MGLGVVVLASVARIPRARAASWRGGGLRGCENEGGAFGRRMARPGSGKRRSEQRRQAVAESFTYLGGHFDGVGDVCFEKTERARRRRELCGRWRVAEAEDGCGCLKWDAVEDGARRVFIF
ncbi:hypothetical protein HDV57DRAFT_504934 [Trichoderma longibrachiatum]